MKPGRALSQGTISTTVGVARGDHRQTPPNCPFHKPGAGCAACPSCWRSRRTAVSSSRPIEQTATSRCACSSTPTPTRARSRRLSLRLREQLCSPARTPRCRSCRIAPGTLLRPGPPRNRTGTFQRIRLEQAVEVRWRNVIRSAHKAGACRPRVRSPRRCAAASNLSVGSGIVVFFFSLAYLTASARFRAGPQGSVSGRLCGTAAWRGQPSCPGFPLRFRRRHSLLGHPMPAEELGSPHGRLIGHPRWSRPLRSWQPRPSPGEGQVGLPV